MRCSVFLTGNRRAWIAGEQEVDPMPLRRPIQCLMLMCLCLAFAVPACGREASLLEALRLEAPLAFCGEAVPMDLPHVRERFEKAMMLALSDRAQVLLWIKRAPRYLPLIDETLRTMKMPADLKYLAVAESALRPHAGSTKGAMGFWQLMPGTARKYGLRVDPYIDQRRNIYFSTASALRFLKNLHTRFSSWTLAAAAYNMGEEGLTAEILEQNTRDYYNLYLPLETQQFVFRILAVKLILSAPQRYGFAVVPQDLYQPLVFDTVDVDCFQETPIRIVAQAAGTYFKVIKDLNPHVRGYYLEPGHHQVNLPRGRADGFAVRFKKLVAKNREERQTRIYIVQAGDSLSEIADHFKVPLAAILIWNRIGIDHSIHPGDRLVIYPGMLEP
jgi:membrane-bound lytic murein transglycosylase D